MIPSCLGWHNQRKAYLWRRLVAVLQLSFFLFFAGCAAVGPDYAPPERSVPAAWHTELRQGLSGEAADVHQLSSWWEVLNDSVLTSLIEQAVDNNFDLQLAVARVREARARRGISRAAQLPAMDASGLVTRSQSSGGGPTRNFYVVGLDAGWEVDIFGGVRRTVEAAEAELAASHEGLRDVLVSLTAEIALNYLDTRTLQSRLAIAASNLAMQQQTFDLVNARCQAGLSDQLALQQARYNLESTRSRIPTLRSSLEEAKNRLAVLAGAVPGSVHELLAEARPIPVIPPMVAVGVPAEALRQRPDIRRAEYDLAAQTARIGVATADLYPKFRLAGSIGLESLSSTELFTSTSKNWSIGPRVSWNIFDAGAIRQNIEVQSAIQEQYVCAYEAAVLGALEEVENVLAAYAEEQLRRERLVDAVDAARQVEALAAIQYHAGLVDFAAVLDAQRSLLSFEDQLAESDGMVTANLVRLYKVLGGGWRSSSTLQFPGKG
ncbi:MAG: efflux transporter outer membrane subunit [Deltaproteobacteria bacterium]|nr:efflux transporter outer membrane subunit [Candidatus Anaeroferrophillus wilburensis]MBN2890200.1 efflux transporter outer membrane subunit [Deltaproteobacteria bacterium]